MSASMDRDIGPRPRRPSGGVALNVTSYTGVPIHDKENERDEKPWERMVHQMTKKGKHLYEPVKSLPSTYLLLLLGGYLLLGYLTQLIEDDMPSVVLDADVPIDVHDIFSEESALRYLQDVTGTLPRVSGTAYHLNKTVDMKALVDKIAGEANQVVRTDWQIVTGHYYLQNRSPYLNVYENASNIIALLEGESGFHSNGTIGSSILVNCHYDSVPFAMGASDNAAFCAIMLEILSRLSKGTRKFKHNIVFLFNGAEENGLQASHGFLQHEWAAGLRCVVNLDAAGMNGKPSVFQVTDPRVARAYGRSAPRPAAQAVGEFLFSAGIIPSDTDFRIFRDFGDLHGMDVAFTKWGHVYHTRYDRADLILPGVIQNAGDMLMALLGELGDMDEINTKMEPTSLVYYDYLNMFMIQYSTTAAYVVDAMIALLALVSVLYYVWLVGPRMSTVKELLFAVLSRIASAVGGIILAAICASITIATTVQLRYLAHPWLVVPLFWMPYVIGAVVTSHMFDAWRTRKCGLSRRVRTLQAMAGTRLVLAVTLGAACAAPLAAVRYVLAVPLACMALTSLVTLNVTRLLRLHAWQHLCLEVLFSVPPAMFLLMVSVRLLATLLPTMGRSPSLPPDATVAVVNVGMAALLSCTVSGIELLFSRRRLWLTAGVVGATCVVLFFIPFSPYQDDGPSTMRHYWFHSEIVTFDRNKVPSERTTAVVINKLDVNTPPYVRSALGAVPLGGERGEGEDPCTDSIYCNLPLFRTSFAAALPEALILHMEGPAAFSPPPDVSETHVCERDNCTYRFIVTGAAHNTLTLWPLANVSVRGWSFGSPLRESLGSPLQESFQQRGRPVYVIVHSLATYSDTVRPLEFTVDLTVPEWMQPEPALQVSLHAHAIFHPEQFTAQYRRLLAAAPQYYNIASFLSYRHNYVF